MRGRQEGEPFISCGGGRRRGRQEDEAKGLGRKAVRHASRKEGGKEGGGRTILPQGKPPHLPASRHAPPPSTHLTLCTALHCTALGVEGDPPAPYSRCTLMTMT